MQTALEARLFKREQLNQKIIALLSLLYFIAVIWVVVFKCNQNDLLCMEKNREATIFERLERGFSKNPISVIRWSIKNRHYPELLAVVFHFFGFLPIGVSLGCICDKVTSYLVAFVTCLGIELFQLFTGYGGFEVTDIVINTLGCFVGIILFQTIISKRNAARINKIATVLLYMAIPFDLFFIVNTILHFPG